MRQIRQLLQLHFEHGLSQRLIARSLGVARSTVERVLARLAASGLSWPVDPVVTDAELERRLYRGPAHQAAAKRCARPDYAEVVKELSRKGVTRLLLWSEYRNRHADGIGYSVFCDELAGYLAAADALVGFTRQMRKIPACMRESFTYDRGSELACHAELAKNLNLDIWFADPHAPWQRGSNENTNGLLRQFLPKGTDLSNVSQMQLNEIAHLLNNRPRKTLGWKTPAEVMQEEISAFRKRVALDS